MKPEEYYKAHPDRQKPIIDNPLCGAIPWVPQHIDETPEENVNHAMAFSVLASELIHRGIEMAKKPPFNEMPTEPVVASIVRLIMNEARRHGLMLHIGADYEKKASIKTTALTENRFGGFDPFGYMNEKMG